MSKGTPSHVFAQDPAGHDPDANLGYLYGTCKLGESGLVGKGRTSEGATRSEVVQAMGDIIMESIRHGSAMNSTQVDPIPWVPRTSTYLPTYQANNYLSTGWYGNKLKVPINDI